MLHVADGIIGRHNTAPQQAATEFCTANSMKAWPGIHGWSRHHTWVNTTAARRPVFTDPQLRDGECTTESLKGFSALLSGKHLLQ